MAWTQSVVPNSFKNEMLIGVHVFGTDVLKTALYDNTITPQFTDTVYSTTGELPTVGGYTQGGVITPVASTYPKLVNNVAVVDFDDVAWTSASFTAYGCKIYSTTKANKLIAQLWFNGAKTVSSGTFTIVWPAGDDVLGTLRVG